MPSWGKVWTRCKKSKNPAATSEVSGAKAGYCAWSLHTARPRGWADHPRHSFCPTHGSAPTRTPFKGSACPSSGSKQGNLLLVFIPSCCSTSPNKALSEFLVWPLINFYCLKSPRTQVGNTWTWGQWTGPGLKGAGLELVSYPEGQIPYLHGHKWFIKSLPVLKSSIICVFHFSC